MKTKNKSRIAGLVAAARERYQAAYPASVAARECAEKLAREANANLDLVTLLGEALGSPVSPRKLCDRRGSEEGIAVGVYFFEAGASPENLFENVEGVNTLVGRLRIRHINQAEKAGLLKAEPGAICHVVRMWKSLDDLYVVQRGTLRLDVRQGFLHHQPNTRYIPMGKVTVCR